MTGSLAALTIPAIKNSYENRSITGYAQELATARGVLAEMKS